MRIPSCNSPRPATSNASVSVSEAETFKALGPLLFDEAKQPAPAEINSEKLTRESRESLDGPPLTTCKAWAIADAKTGRVLWGHKEADKLDIAIAEAQDAVRRSRGRGGKAWSFSQSGLFLA